MSRREVKIEGDAAPALRRAAALARWYAADLRATGDADAALEERHAAALAVVADALSVGPRADA